MAAPQKRTRAAFEADLQAQQSPYVFFGTPLPPLDPKVRDDGSYVPVWKQEVTDERGRKRLHGAFTGGFSAGYFNTVGSKEGWTPASFVSSRSKRHNAAAQTAEDFMDEEDLREAEEAQQVQTNSEFSGIGSTAEEVAGREPVMDLLRSAGESMGVKLLKKMGWREGQGIGPRVRRRARNDDGTEDAETHLFAPDDSPLVAIVRKTDRKGLGFEGVGRLTAPTTRDEDDEDEDSMFSRITKAKKKPHVAKSGMGLGILNDDGSDEEDPYSIGPRLSYNRVIGGDKKKKKKAASERPGIRNANPLLQNKPVFVSKRAGGGGARGKTCHDGRPPPSGFVLALHPPPPPPSHPPPEVPPDWKPSGTEGAPSDADSSTHQSSADLAKTSTLDPSARGSLLGESKLPGKSVFSYITPTARDRLANLTHKTSLPAAGSESYSAGSQDDPATLIPLLEPTVARAALGRGVAGFVPYADDAEKLARYRGFLAYRAGTSETTPTPASDVLLSDWAQELAEFAHAATIFRPMSGMMASRFASSSASSSTKAPQDSSGADEPLPSSTAAADPAREAARLGMFGALTRSSAPFYPTRLLCKRFGVPAPSHAATEDPSGGGSGGGGKGQQPSTAPASKFASAGFQLDPHSTQLQATAATASHAAAEPVSSAPAPRASAETVPPPRKDVRLLGDARMQALLRDAGYAAEAAQVGREGGGKGDGGGEDGRGPGVDPERNEALEQERAGEALFRAVFGSEESDEGE